ncbi:energy-coupling factor ABC transporter permease [Actinomarinicola tropica]|uniref:Cobalt ABC transporter permease n=1 Tax=Actinomarinicola tropica TaxID=2789776 RepID=A0A5Q2RQA9_9ACTN|nr:energy-coupling factor ABC transporter permease [Actinomarinicola tropica]QGG96317.1 cobalt ABC transporter permease [Actinomarinicola tropica]
MHLPDGILSGHAEIVGAVAAAGGLAVAARAARHQATRVPAGRIAAVGALVFAGQMVNVPVASGTSGHLLGAALAVALLGPGIGILTTAAVLAVQALAFADGGVSSLGLNVLNMAVVPGAVAAALIGTAGSATRAPRLAAAAGLGTLAAASAFSLQYALASLRGEPAGTVVADMLAVHVPIAVLEVALTLAAVAAARAVDARPAAVALGAVAVAALVAPWASSAPDGLERVAIDRDFASLAGAHPLDGSPLADYAVAGVDHQILTVAIAGAVGVALVAALLGGSARLARAVVRA